MHLLGRVCHKNVHFVAAALFKHEIVLLIKCVVFVVVKILLIRPFRRCVMKHKRRDGEILFAFEYIAHYQASADNIENCF